MEADALARRRRKPPRPARAAAPGPLARPRLGVARQAVVRDRVPGRRVRGELTVARADPGIVVEGAEADAHDLLVLLAPAPQVRAAGRAEELGEAVRGAVGAEQLLAREEAQRP